MKMGLDFTFFLKISNVQNEIKKGLLIYLHLLCILMSFFSCKAPYINHYINPDINHYINHNHDAVELESIPNIYVVCCWSCLLQDHNPSPVGFPLVLPKFLQSTKKDRLCPGNPPSVVLVALVSVLPSGMEYIHCLKLSAVFLQS